MLMLRITAVIAALVFAGTASAQGPLGIGTSAQGAAT